MMESLKNPYIRLKIINFSYNFIYTQRFIKKKKKEKKMNEMKILKKSNMIQSTRNHLKMYLSLSPKKRFLTSTYTYSK